MENKNFKILKVRTVILGVFNIVLGLFFMLIVFMMQGFFLFFFGIFFIIFGIGLFNRKIYKKLFFYGIVPGTILFSINIIMLGVAKDIPKYYQTPLSVGILIVIPFWFVILGDFFIWKSGD